MKNQEEKIGGLEMPRPMTQKEIEERQYRQKERDIKIARTRAGVVRNQIIQAYTILESIRFDYIGDSAFRDKIVTAKRGCETALSDFLLDDCYYDRKIKNHRELTPSEYAISIDPNNQTTVSDQGTGK